MATTRKNKTNKTNTTAQAETTQPTTTKKGTTTMNNKELITAKLTTALPPNNIKVYINAEGKQKPFYTERKEKDGVIYKDITISQGYQLLFKTESNDYFIIHINNYVETSKAGNAYRSASIFINNATQQLNMKTDLYLYKDQDIPDVYLKQLINQICHKPLNFIKTAIPGKDYFNYNIEQPAPLDLPFKLI